MLSAILAAALTFTVTATGVEKGSPVEFFFAGKGTDHDYETMFILDDPVDVFCAKLEQAGVPRGRPTDEKSGRLWPVGCTLTFEPSLSTYIAGKMPEGYHDSLPIYTGGLRLPDGSVSASTNMPLSLFSSYTLTQSPIVYNGIYNQGDVYGSFTARETLKKGARYTFTVRADPKTMPRHIHLTAKPGKGVDLVKTLKAESEKGEIDVLLGFDETLTVKEASAIAAAANAVDSPVIKLNGITNIFYRSFLPLVKWRDRKERLIQPFELTLGETDKLVFIEEDWSVDGPDPKLTPREIAFADAPKYPKTTTCLIYATPETTVARLMNAMKKLKGSSVSTWYVFSE